MRENAGALDHQLTREQLAGIDRWFPPPAETFLLLHFRSFERLNVLHLKRLGAPTPCGLAGGLSEPPRLCSARFISGYPERDVRRILRQGLRGQ